MKRKGSWISTARLLNAVTLILAIAYLWQRRTQPPPASSAAPQKPRRAPSFTLLPRASASLELQDAIQAVIEKERVLERLPRYATTVVWIEDAIADGATLEEAHEHWTNPTRSELTPPGAFPLQRANVRCPAGLVRVVIDCMIRRTGGMSSYYGFDGYFASLLIDPEKGIIWDARGEHAS